MKREEILEKLVSFNNIDDLENIEIMDFAGNYLKELGFKIEYIYNKVKDKKCLVAKFGKPNLLFIGHTDTVNCNDWDYNPFKLTKDGDKLHGLGTCDMKGGIAAFISAVSEIDLNTLNKGIEIILTFGEETTFEGIELVDKFQDDWPENVIVGEPTSLIPIIATKGCMEYKAIFTGVSVHSSRLVKGKNAIIASLPFINDLLEFSEELKNTTNILFETPYATMNIGKINGGKGINVVPDICEVCFDFRTVKKNQNDMISKKMNKLAKKYSITIEELTNVLPVENNSDVSIFEDITGNKRQAINYATEACFINKKNVIILGVGPNNEHMKNEYITTYSYNKTIEVYKKLISYYCK